MANITCGYDDAGTQKTHATVAAAYAAAGSTGDTIQLYWSGAHKENSWNVAKLGTDYSDKRVGFQGMLTERSRIYTVVAGAEIWHSPALTASAYSYSHCEFISTKGGMMSYIYPDTASCDVHISDCVFRGYATALYCYLQTLNGTTNRVRVDNSMFVGNNIGITIGDVVKMELYFNTFASNGTGLYTSNTPTPLMKSNLFIENALHCSAGITQSGTQIEYNYGTYQDDGGSETIIGSNPDSNNTTAAVKLWRDEDDRPFDYRVLDTSDAVGKGVAVSGLGTDAFGVTRANPPSCGWHEGEALPNAADYPAESDVRLNVVYASTTMTGNCRVPTAAQTESGVVFNTLDSVTGTYVTPPVASTAPTALTIASSADGLTWTVTATGQTAGASIGLYNHSGDALIAIVDASARTRDLTAGQALYAKALESGKTVSARYPAPSGVTVPAITANVDPGAANVLLSMAYQVDGVADVGELVGVGVSTDPTDLDITDTGDGKTWTVTATTAAATAAIYLYKHSDNSLVCVVGNGDTTADLTAGVAVYSKALEDGAAISNRYPAAAGVTVPTISSLVNSPPTEGDVRLGTVYVDEGTSRTGTWTGTGLPATPSAPSPPTAAISHWFVDWNNRGFWPVALQADHEPHVLGVYTANFKGAGALLLGGTDGHIRRYSNTAGTDEGADIASFVEIGPVRLAGNDQNEGVVNELVGTVGGKSGVVQWEVKTAPTEEELSAVDAAETGQWSRVGYGGRNFTERPRARGGAFSLILRGTDDGQSWSVENVHAVIKSAGKQRLL